MLLRASYGLKAFNTVVTWLCVCVCVACVCVCVCMCACVRACVHECECVCVCYNVCVSVRVCVCIDLPMSAYVCTVSHKCTVEDVVLLAEVQL